MGCEKLHTQLGYCTAHNLTTARATVLPLTHLDDVTCCCTRVPVRETKIQNNRSKVLQKSMKFSWKFRSQQKYENQQFGNGFLHFASFHHFPNEWKCHKAGLYLSQKQNQGIHSP